MIHENFHANVPLHTYLLSMTNNVMYVDIKAQIDGWMIYNDIEFDAHVWKDLYT